MRLIDLDILLEDLSRTPYANGIIQTYNREDVYKTILNQEVIHPLDYALDNFNKGIELGYDTGKRNANSQIKWERDMAMEQLEKNNLVFLHKDYQGWIPIKERLPEKTNEWYITTTKENEVDISYFQGTYWDNVIAWRPLPLPYEEKKQ